MTIQIPRVETHPQLIPTNEGGRTFSSPPKALQSGITPNNLFYIRNHWKEPPKLDSSTYRLVVNGEVRYPLNLSMDDIVKMPQHKFQVTLECCGNGPIPESWGSPVSAGTVMERVTGHGIMSNGEWTGVSLAHVLKMAGLKSTAVEVMFSGADSGPDEIGETPPDVTYERSLPLLKATHPDTLLAYEMNGEPLPIMHGHPLRLIVPGWYGMTSIKWLVNIQVLDHTFKGFYQTQRYMTINGPDAPTFYTYHTEIKVKSIITAPTIGEVVPKGRYTVSGKAWSGENEIAEVELSTDGGTHWHKAHLLPRSGYSWHRWEYQWDTPSSGNYILMSRATN